MSLRQCPGGLLRWRARPDRPWCRRWARDGCLQAPLAPPRPGRGTLSLRCSAGRPTARKARLATADQLLVRLISW